MIGWFFELLNVIMNWKIIEIEIVLNFNLNFIRIFYWLKIWKYLLGDKFSECLLLISPT